MKKIKENHLEFLIEIKENNNRKWFIKNKDRYLGIKKEIELFAAHWFSELNAFDESLQILGTKEYMFRIYRDARFAKGKPYKTNYGLLISSGGKPSMHKKSGYFLNIEPNNSFLVGGIWRPEPKVLENIRKDIDYDSTKIRKIINNKNLKKYFELSGEKLKTVPRGYKKDHSDIDLLRYKDFYVIHQFSDKEVLSETFFEELVKLSKIIYPLGNYLNNLGKNKKALL